LGTAWLFTEAILHGRPIKLFNHGDMQRDFTYIDDVVAGVLACLDRPPRADATTMHRLYNIGNHKSENLTRFVEVLEAALGRKATTELLPMQPGDVYATYADIAATTRDFGFLPTISIEEGLPRFVAWYRDYHKV
jgi:UDP-glucuronate 4-epimerase